MYSVHLYTLFQTKRGEEHFAITSPNVNQFLKILSQCVYICVYGFVHNFLLADLEGSGLANFNKCCSYG